MKKIIFALSTFLVATINFAQLKVESNGNVAVKTTSANSYYSLTVDQPTGYNGAILVNYPQYNPAHSFRLSVNPTNTILGSSNGKLAFYYTSYNTVYASSYQPSDRNIKTDINKLENGLEILMELETFTYHLKSDLENGEKKLKYGFISQQAKSVLPDITDEMMGVLCMEYDQIIPILVKGIQEQQNIINSQNEKILTLENKLIEIENLLFKLANHTDFEINDQNQISNGAVLFQNKPNPFRESTLIKYELPESFNSASIMIFNMTGELLQEFPLDSRQQGELKIEGRQFKPGMYLYSLIVDDIEVDTKKMILNK
ncbi:tail fiber domain-containing protein [Paracrocinitomix mangrovi]|uniref:tail fiber domain-containing protein n=1 Tax=Paracrocinitomix mangrovi TaxID=2862509 RepID=UPI001C8CF8E6|nr:tail fiber domain-containing protein [Paracrocinitomix mangrovi]UKN01822.1 tail fiber domain-containing protein [Paracrocinitomix mangrovi]